MNRRCERAKTQERLHEVVGDRPFAVRLKFLVEGGPHLGEPLCLGFHLAAFHDVASTTGIQAYQDPTTRFWDNLTSVIPENLTSTTHFSVSGEHGQRDAARFEIAHLKEIS